MHGMPEAEPAPLLIDRHPLPDAIGGDLRRQIAFVVEVDRMKAVLRQSHVAAVHRRENDAEHSWHLALAAIVLAEHAREDVDRARVVELVVLHDLVEVYAGDVSLHDTAGRVGQEEREVAAADRLYALLPPEQGARLRAAWDEFEAHVTPEARFARAMDRFQPLLLAWASQDVTWAEDGVTAESVRGMLRIIDDGSPVLWDAAQVLVDESERRGRFGPRPAADGAAEAPGPSAGPPVDGTPPADPTGATGAGLSSAPADLTATARRAAEVQTPPIPGTPYPPVPLSTATHDRADRLRRDEAWLEAARRAPATRVLLLDAEGRIVVRTPGAAGDDRSLPADPAAGVPGHDVRDGDAVVIHWAGPETLEGVDVPTLLGLRPDGSAVFAARAPAARETRGFRELLGDLDATDAGMLAHAVALWHWQRSHRFCGVCGTETVLGDAGHRRRCPGCGATHHPRTDPVATMLVTDGGDRVLLSRRRGAQERVWSALAGFVEPGEAPEQTVAREVLEEVGLQVREVRPIGGQPWPSPHGLMIGHRAIVEAGEPILDGELLDARWWDREELRAAVDADEVRLPPPFTIGHHAISGWLAEG